MSAQISLLRPPRSRPMALHFGMHDFSRKSSDWACRGGGRNY